ncbi:MAG: lysophospholipid acyltransferase family protein [bacterium]
MVPPIQESLKKSISSLKERGEEVRWGYRLTQLFLQAIFKGLFGLKVIGRENIPSKGPFIIASNHQSWFDPPIVGSSCPRELAYAAKAELFRNLVLGPVVKYFNAIPVKRKGFDRLAIRELEKRIENAQGVVIFPEGTRFLDGKLRPPRPGIGMLMAKYNVPVIPTFVDGSRRLRYQIGKRALKITFGIPFLPSELQLSDIPGNDLYDRYAWAVMERIAQTGGVSPPHIRSDPQHTSI